MGITRTLPNLTPKIELFGDWEQVDDLLKHIDKTIMAGAILGQKSAADKIIKIVKKNIRENGGSIGWQPLSERYAARKERDGYNPDTILRMTGLYYRSINSWSNGLNYYVGVKKNVKHPRKQGKSSLTLVQIANILEHGSVVRNIPARPLWLPSYKQFGGNVRLKGLMVGHIRTQIMLRHRVRAKVTF